MNEQGQPTNLMEEVKALQLQVGELQKEREALRLMWESEREAVKNLTAEVGESNRLKDVFEDRMKYYAAEADSLTRKLMEWESGIRRAMDKIEPVEHTSELLCEVMMILGSLVGPLGTTRIRPKGPCAEELEGYRCSKESGHDAAHWAQTPNGSIQWPRSMDKRVEPSQNHHAHNWAIYNPASVDDPRLICKDCGFIQYA